MAIRQTCPLTGTVHRRAAKAGSSSRRCNIVAGPSARQEDDMARRVIDNIREIADQLRDQATEAERIGRLPDDSAKLLKAAGPIKLLQPKQYGGFEAHPREFAETVMDLAALDGAAGWICGVVGVHPWELALADPGSRRRSGATTRTPGSPRRTRRWGCAARRRRVRLQRPLAVLLRHGPLRLDLPRRHARRRRRQRRRPPVHAARDPAPLRLRDRRGLLGRRRAQGNRQQGRHRPATPSCPATGSCRRQGLRRDPRSGRPG